MHKILTKTFLLIFLISLTSCIKKDSELEDSKKSSIVKQLNGSWVIEPNLSDTFSIKLNNTESFEDYIDLEESYKGATVRVTMNNSSGTLKLRTEGVKGKKFLKEEKAINSKGKEYTKRIYSEVQLIPGSQKIRSISFRVMKVGKTYVKVRTKERIMYLRIQEGFLVLDQFYNWSGAKKGQNSDIPYKFMFKKGK